MKTWQIIALAAVAGIVLFLAGSYSLGWNI
ncbi:hypothetical protein Mpt1_c08180 [Candidatus Methanoplasma termitum]|uniref:Uncharacterized protein n=1 Tax=Candidatus Methanoplasma termitum TaxID=1577791 RepID=A0A0A7LEG8_9ARCH|nr:hypothetical protein Mpt1_c08180 [Candidatus Methanoplasma termitum]